MKGAACRGFLAVAVVAALTAVAWAAEPTDVTDGDRLYRNFAREAATVQPGQIRLEVQGMTMQDDENTVLNLNGLTAPRGTERVQGGVFNVLGSYGLGDRGEVGFVIPTFIQTTEVRTTTQKVDPTNQPVFDSNGNPVFVKRTRQDEDVGDVQLYGKFRQQIAEHCALATGLELWVPTGIEKKGFGTGDVGINPFMSTRYQRGQFGMGGHIGYQMFSGEVENVLNYSVEAFVRATASYAIRAELSGRLFKANGMTINDVVILPGIDYSLTPSFTIRPTGLANVTDEAIDWGIGLGLAYVF